MIMDHFNQLITKNNAILNKNTLLHTILRKFVKALNVWSISKDVKWPGGKRKSKRSHDGEMKGIITVHPPSRSDLYPHLTPASCGMKKVRDGIKSDSKSASEKELAYFLHFPVRY